MMVWKGLSQTEASVFLRRLCHRQSCLIHFLARLIADFVNKPKLGDLCLFLGVIAVAPMLWAEVTWARSFLPGSYSVARRIDTGLGASVGDFFGRKSFGTIRGNMNLFSHLGRHSRPFRRRRDL